MAAGSLSILGTGFSWTIVARLTGNLRPPAGATQWALVAAMAVVPTMFAISAFLSALPRIGPTRTALLSTVEPVVTVTLAFGLLGDRFGPSQLVGAALILASAVLLQLPGPAPDPPVPKAGRRA